MPNMPQYMSVAIFKLQQAFRDNAQSGGDTLDPNLTQKEVLQMIKRHGRLDAVQELSKSNEKAATLRSAGNWMYSERRFNAALICYNESICYAEVDSEQLGMGYANRSAVYMELGEYELALYNIDLARKNHYPEGLMAKLLAREQNCRQRIADGHSKGTVPCPRMDINVDTNPRIPFLADGIKMSYDSKFGRGLVAERDFNPGDIILNEKIEMCGVSFELCYQTCNQCGGEFRCNLIPCPTCPFFMYCSQECRELNWKLYHRFECGVATKLCSISCVANMIFARLFFYGLTQFDDDLQAMMDYCKTEVTTPSNPLELDFTNLNRLELFKTLHNVKPRYTIQVEDLMKTIAACHYTVFLKNPEVNSIIRAAPHRLFFLQSLQTYVRIGFGLLMAGATSLSEFTNIIRPIGGLINHSCDPNATMDFDSGHFKVFLLRAVRKGEQIFTFNGTAWWLPEMSRELHFKCECIFCDRGPAGRKWRKQNGRSLPPKALQDIRTLQAVIKSGKQSLATNLNAIQQFMKRLEHTYPQGGNDVGQLLKLFHCLLYDANRAGNAAEQRAKLQAMVV